MRVTRLFGKIAVAAALVAATVAPSFADGACKSEIDRLCTGEKQVLACLRKNAKDLSPGCTTYLQIFESIPSCLQDAAKLCPNEKPSVTSVLGCLRGHQSALSADCKAEIEKVR